MPKIWTHEELHLSDELTIALNTINWNYGRGEIIGFSEVTIACTKLMNSHGTAVCKLQNGTCTAKFRVVNGTLFFRGHQKKIKTGWPPRPLGQDRPQPHQWASHQGGTQCPFPARVAISR